MRSFNTDFFGRTPLEVLQFELDFLQQGGYGRRVQEPTKPRVPFVDSPSCLNFLESNRPHACDGCVLMAFVPEGQRSESVPCHHIPLDPQGNTIAGLATTSDDPKIIATLEHWLRTAVDRLRLDCA